MFISATEISVVVAKIAYFVPRDQLSLIVIAFFVGTIVRATVISMLAMTLQFAVFWASCRVLRDSCSPPIQLAVFGYSILPGLLGAAATRSMVAVLAPGDVPLQSVRLATSVAAFVENAPKYLTLLDPFLILSVALLSIGHATVTDRKRGNLVSLLTASISVLFTRIVF